MTGGGLNVKLVTHIAVCTSLLMVHMLHVTSSPLQEELREANGQVGAAKDHKVGGERLFAANLTSLSLRRLLRAKSSKCDRYPNLCRAKGSLGPDCCKRVCTNTRIDRLNCGRCGRRCRFGEACCRGRCVNVAFDESNCGACGRKCKKHTHCRHGICGYA